MYKGCMYKGYERNCGLVGLGRILDSGYIEFFILRVRK